MHSSGAKAKAARRAKSKGSGLGTTTCHDVNVDPRLDFKLSASGDSRKTMLRPPMDEETQYVTPSESRDISCRETLLFTEQTSAPLTSLNGRGGYILSFLILCAIRAGSSDSAGAPLLVVPFCQFLYVSAFRPYSPRNPKTLISHKVPVESLKKHPLIPCRHRLWLRVGRYLIVFKPPTFVLD
uniref:Uncharacterized protein n=1 Tax=Kalanchoe fedtschenkoi TaxID=63787 RepID=A0A7N0TLH5_KALFE